MSQFEKKITYRSKNRNSSGQTDAGPATLYLVDRDTLIPVEVDVYTGLRDQVVALVPTWNQDSCKEGRKSGTSVLKMGPEGQLFVDRELVVPFARQQCAKNAPSKTKICLQADVDDTALRADIYADSEGKVTLLVPQGSSASPDGLEPQAVYYYGVGSCSLHF